MNKPMTLGELLEAFKGLDPDAPVLVGIINGDRFNAAYAQPQVCSGVMAAYLCCYEEALPWDWSPPPGVTISVNQEAPARTPTTEFNPSAPKPEPFG